MYVGTNGTSGSYEKTLRKKKSVEEERTSVKSVDSIQKKNSFTKVKETRKCSLNGGVKASDHEQVSIDEVTLIKFKHKSFYFQNGPDFIIYKEHFLIHNRRPSNIQIKKSDEEKLSRKSSFSSVLENVGKPVTNLCMSDNFDPDQDKFQTALNSRKSTVESEKCW